MNATDLVNNALAKARQKVASAAPTKKEASVPANTSLIEEAEKCAEALEFVSIATADEDGSLVGTARAEIVRSFHKLAAESKGPHSGPTTTTGTQAVAPQAGSKKLVKPGLTGGNHPAESTAPEGKMSREALAQTPPANPSKSAAAGTLFDLIMRNKVADDGPREMTSTDSAPSRPKGQEGGAQADSALASNDAPVKAEKAKLHAPTRARLSEIFAHSGDTAQSLAAAKAAWPQAFAKGSLKVAGLVKRAKSDEGEHETENMPKHEKKESKAKEKAEEAKTEKKGSVREYSALWDAALGGQLGAQARAAAEGIAQSIEG